MSIYIEGVKSSELESMLGQIAEPLPPAPEPFDIEISSLDDIAARVTTQQDFNDLYVEKIGALLYRNNIMQYKNFYMTTVGSSGSKAVGLSITDPELHIPMYSIGPMKFPTSFQINMATIFPTDTDGYRKSEITIENLRWKKEMYLDIVMFDIASYHGRDGDCVEFSPTWTPKNAIYISTRVVKWVNKDGLTLASRNNRNAFPNFGQVLFGQDITPEDLDDPVWVINHYCCPKSIKHDLESESSDFTNPEVASRNLYGWPTSGLTITF